MKTMTPGTDNCGKMEKNLDPSQLKEAIHSGHFMVSDIDDSEVQDDGDVSVPVLDAEDRAEVVPERGPFNFDNACKETSDTYTFGPRSAKSISIDATLTKLFQCMTIAYSGKLTSPRWKNFKGLKLRWKDKIRLNNVIWRAWHMQFVKRRSPIVCQFASPLDGDTHNKPEAVVLEGKYWKRRLETVCAEYKKWRLFYKEQTERSRAMSDVGFDPDLFNWQPRSNQSFHSANSMIVDDDPFADFNDTLFSCLIPNQPFAFPNPREIARAGLADFIQPGLVQLQPNLDASPWDFMDTLDMFIPRHSEESSLQDLFNSSSRPPPASQECFNAPMMPQPPQNESLSFSRNKSYSDNSLLSYSVDENDYMDTSLSNIESDVPKISNVMSLVPISNLENIQELPLVSETSPPLDQQICSSLGSPTDSSSIESPPQAQTRYSPSSGMFLGSQSVSITPVAYPSKNVDHNKYVNILPAPQESTSSTRFPKQNILQRLVQPAPTPAVFSRSQISCAPEPKHSSRTKLSSVIRSSNHMDTSRPSKQDVFVVPKNTTKLRSRSMSGPQISSSPCNKAPSTIPSSNVLSSVTPVIPQSALLAQLLTTGTYLQTSKEELPSSSTAVTIISTAVTSPQSAQTVVISPITINSANDLSNQVTPTSEQLASRNKSLPCLSVTPIENLTTKGNSSSASNLSVLNSHSILDTRTSPPKPFRPKSETERVQYREHRRVCHINAEQKRRCNIKTGFDTLHMLVPSLSQNPNAKVSKAAMLQKAGEYIVQLRSERAQFQEEADQLRKQIENLNQAISVCQSQLPATGAPVSRQCASKIRDMFDDYVRKRTLQNWKFWIFSALIQPLLETYNNSVSTANLMEMCRTVLTWVEQHCSLVSLRPAVLNSLRHLSTTTNILTDPTKIAEEATTAVTKKLQTRD